MNKSYVYEFPIFIGGNQRIESAVIFGCQVYPLYQGSKFIRNLMDDELEDILQYL